MTDGTYRSGWIGIGELSRRTDVPVRTIRYYCDEGLLTPHRTTGGHRVFDPAVAVEGLLLIRRLRALGLGMSAVTAVVTGVLPLADAITVERAAVEDELDDLLWRRAALRAVETAASAERLDHLEVLASVRQRAIARDGVVAFWRQVLRPLPGPLFDGFVTMNIPLLPADPEPGQVLAFARLVALVSEPRFPQVMAHHLRQGSATGPDEERRLLTGIATAGALVAPLLLAGAPPRPGPELDRFVAAHASVRRVPDTEELRGELARVAAAPDPRIDRYWALTSEIIGPATSGAAHGWFHRALRVRSSPEDPSGNGRTARDSPVATSTRGEHDGADRDPRDDHAQQP